MVNRRHNAHAHALAHTAAARDSKLCRLWVLGSLFLHHFPCVIRHSLAQTRSALTQLLESSALSVGTDMDRRHRTPFRIRAIQHLLRRPTQLRLGPAALHDVTASGKCTSLATFSPFSTSPSGAFWEWMSCFSLRCSQARKATLTSYRIALHTSLTRGAPL